MFEELFEPNNPGERELKQALRAQGYKVRDVSDNSCYWSKDIDLIVTNTATGKITNVEVKWDYYIANTGNLFIELSNPRSKGGNGWFKFCEADALAYGDAHNKVFYTFDFPQLREFINEHKKEFNCRTTADGSYGYLVPLALVKHLVKSAVAV